MLEPIEYADSVERQKYLLSFDDKICSQGGKPFDTTGGFVPGEDGACPFAISEDEEWYAKAGNFDDNSFNHSSFLSGAPALLAGTIRVAGGTLQYISNRGGHYAPKISDLLKGAECVRSCGLDQTARHNVSILVADHEGRYGGEAGSIYLFPYTSFLRLKGAVLNPANYALGMGVADQLRWKMPDAERPDHHWVKHERMRLL